MTVTPVFLRTACVSLIVGAIAFPGRAQTFKIAPDAPAKPETQRQTPSQANQTQPAGQSLGFGSNIQNARLGRAAELALQHGDHAMALNYAQRAAQAAPNDPQLWFLVGYAARLNGKTQLSAEAYSRGLRLKPSSLEGISGLAQTYSVMGRTDEATRLLKQVLASDPRRRDDALLLGNIYLRAGNYTDAIDWLGRAERSQPDVRSELLLAISYQHLKQMDQASRYLEMAKRRSPDNPEVQRSLAGYYREMGNYPEAIAALKSIRNPKPDVKAELAYTYQLDGKLDDAARLYAQAANASPRDIGLQLSAAQAAVAIGSIDQASPFLKRAAGIDADYYRLHAIRGEIAQLQERDSDALREYTAAVAHLPASPAEGPLYGIQLHMDLMQLHQNLHDPENAHRELEIAQNQIGAMDDRGPGRAQFLRLRALIKMNAGQLDSAMSDAKEALALNSRDPNSLQLDGDLLMKMGRTEDAIAVYKQVLTIDPASRLALTSLGYASRLAGHDREAEKYFERLAQVAPTLYVPYLALGDMYTARRQFPRAQAAYAKAYALAPGKALIMAGGMNAAIEAQKLDLAGIWLSRTTSDMQQEPQILREKERYLSFRGQPEQSAEVGREAIKVLPNDRDVVVYLGYDLLNLQKYDELLKLTSDYMNVLPKEPDIPLLAGYADKHNGNMEQARQDFSEALRRDPEVVTAYVNRGYVLNNLHEPQLAAADFEAALKREPKNGEAHLGLAYSNLDLNKPRAALQQVQLAEKELGDSEPIHLIRATAYGREGRLTKAIAEYHLALKFDPNDPALHLGLGNALFAQRRYHEAIDELLIAEKLSPNDAVGYALLARAYANLQDREQTLRYVALAEQYAASMPAAKTGKPGRNGMSDIYVSTGQALTTLGDRNAAMEHFQKALAAPNGDRVGVRLAIATLMMQQGHEDDASRQIALAQMEAATGETSPATGEQYIQAADIFREMHEYELSLTYLGHAKAAGASDTSVRVGLANTYLAIGDTARARGELAAVKSSADSGADYQFLLAEANVYRQEHQSTRSLTAFAQASDAAGEDQSAQQSLLQAGGDEGYRVNQKLSVLSNFSVEPIFEDSTVYVLDSKLDGPVPIPPTDFSLLPPPRSSLQTQETAAYHLHLGNWPTASGFFQIRNARGPISVPATNSVVNRDTYDYNANFGLNPTIHVGRSTVTFNSGVQGTIRRDSQSPAQVNQNLFRAFTYVSTSSFFNAISVSGYGIWEAGPFTEINLHSRTLTGAVDFRVGKPWGKTALVTGWGATDQLFTPTNFKNYYTSSYIGLERRFWTRWDARAVAEDVRAWRVVGSSSGIAQNLRPAGTLDFAPNLNWSLHASGAYSSTRSFHAYDVIQDGFSVSYARHIHRPFKDETGEIDLQYPIRFSAGFQQETFFNFQGSKNQQFRPYVSITLF